MVFLGIYRAIYDYVPQSDNEIALAEGDLLMVLEKSSDDDWWKAKKKGSEEDEEEPEGLIPNNYVEEVCVAPPARPVIAVANSSLGRAHCASQSSLRLRAPDRRGALVQRRHPARRLRHHRSRLDLGWVGRRLWLCTGQLH